MIMESVGLRTLEIYRLCWPKIKKNIKILNGIIHPWARAGAVFVSLALQVRSGCLEHSIYRLMLWAKAGQCWLAAVH